MCVFEQGFFYKMDGIKKYSKEWFTLNGTQADKADVKKLAQGIKANSGEDIALDASVFVGTREAFNQKISIYERTGVKNEAAKQTYEAVKTYFADNIFNILYANNDGVIMPDEVKAVASLSEPDSPERMQMKFSTDDIEMLYDNALASVRAAVTEKGDDEIRIKYADGTKTTLKADENGVLETKLDEKKVNGRKQTKLFNYDDNTLTTTYYNKKNQIYKQTVDAEGKANDSVMNRTYNKDGSYKDVTKTVTINILDDEYFDVTDYKKQIQVKTVGAVSSEKFGEIYLIQLKKFDGKNYDEKEKEWIEYLKEEIQEPKNEKIKKLDNLLDDYWKNEVL